jgi:Flp pilus assembly protein TadD
MDIMRGAGFGWKRAALVGVVIGLAAAVGVAIWKWRAPKPVDWNTVLEAHNRAVGIMEKFRYPEAARAFEEVVRLAPDWLPARINLGIALLNDGSDNAPSLQRAQQVFSEVLRREPDNPYAHFCLGFMAKYVRDPQPAIDHFQKVLDKDPNDAYSWYHLGSLLENDPERQEKCYRKALDLQPAMTSAIYGLGQIRMRQGHPKEGRALLDEFEAFDKAGTGFLVGLKYTEQGHYADIIGRPDPESQHTGPLPLFVPREVTVRLADGARWATTADFGQDSVGKLRAHVRARFGATLIALDYNGDDKPDLFLAGAVVEKGQVRDLLLRNDGDGKFTDVTATAGLAAPHPTLGCCAADWDNDGKVDLVLTGAGSQKLFRNKGDGTFEDVSAKAGLDKVKSVCLGAAFVDLDQDADLDLLLAEYAATVEEALTALGAGPKALAGGVKATGRLRVFLNIGEAPSARPDEQPPPLSGEFEAKEVPALTDLAGRFTGVAATDVDGDGDLDILLFADGAAPVVAINDRLLRFRRAELPERGRWNGALVLDADHNERSDLLVLPSTAKPLLLLNRFQPGNKDSGTWFEAGPCDSPSLLQAITTDVDLDGWCDVVGLSSERLPVLLHNEGGILARVPEAFAQDGAWPGDLVAVLACDVGSRGRADLLAWSEGKGLLLYQNHAKGRSGLSLGLKGRNLVEGQNRLRCNMDGIGVWLMAQKGGFWTGQENTTLSAGLGQSRLPLLLGLADAPAADVVRLRWPDGTVQAELDILAEHLARIVQSNKKPGSCPVLFTWDGQRWVFVTDFLGAGSVGELGPNGSCRPPRPEESVKIEPHQLTPRNGRLSMKLAEPMDEVTYLDRLQLVVLDHPAGVRVYPDERFSTGAPPSQRLIAFDREIFPAAARDHRGRDLTETLRRWDRLTADGFARRAWPGFAEEHFIELDFADRLATFTPSDKLYVCLAGWTAYATPASIWGAHQAGVEMKPPVLERQGKDGRWQTVCEAGFPAGLPRMMLLDVTGKLTGPRCRLRLRTNLHVFWDQVFVAAGCKVVSPGAKDGVRATVLEVGSASLDPCGVMQEYSPDGREPTLYDHDRVDRTPVAPPAGKRTRFGDVTELLTAKDDRFVVFGPSDEVTVHFDAAKLPPLPPGWVRSYVLRTWGYCKDSSPFTAKGETIEPLPFAAMRNYPPAPDEHYPTDALHEDYLRRYQTREVGSPSLPARRR